MWHSTEKGQRGFATLRGVVWGVPLYSRRKKISSFFEEQASPELAKFFEACGGGQNKGAI